MPMRKTLPLPPFTEYERQSGYVEEIYLMYNKQYRQLDYMYCCYHKDIVKSGRAGSCIKCTPKPPCNCFTKAGAESCYNELNCETCGVCLMWKGYEEGTKTCGDCST